MNGDLFTAEGFRQRHGRLLRRQFRFREIANRHQSPQGNRPRASHHRAVGTARLKLKPEGEFTLTQLLQRFRFQPQGRQWPQLQALKVEFRQLHGDHHPGGEVTGYRHQQITAVQTIPITPQRQPTGDQIKVCLNQRDR